MEENITGKRDPLLWSIAKKRAGFKSHFYTYLTVNGFLWLIWLVTTPAEVRASQTPWPIWPLMGWGIGLALHFVFTYIIKYDEKEAAQKEYEKLTKAKQ